RMKPTMACHPALQAIRLSAGGETDDATMGLFYNIDAEELMATERRDLVAFHLLAYRLENRRMGDGEPGSLFLEDLLHIFVDRGTLLLVRQGTRLKQRVIELLVAPLRDVLRVRLAIGAAAEKEEEVVGIAIVTGPAEQPHLVLARLKPLAVLAPFKGDELGVDPDLGKIGLHHLGHALGIGVVGALHRHPP